MKTILITGCSKGIGLAAAHTLKARGYTVFPSARKARDVATLKQTGFEHAITLDVDDQASIEQALNYVFAQTGNKLDALFSNAGYGIPGAVEHLSRENMQLQFETNVFGGLALINKVIPIMRAQGHGRIVCNSSILGFVAMPYAGAYNASKFALEGLIDTLRLELAETEIKVILIEPGPIESHFRTSALENYNQHVSVNSNEHAEAYERMKDYYGNKDKSSSFMLGTDAVNKKLIHALESRRPRAHYLIGGAAKMLYWLKRLLPTFLFDKLMLKITKEK